MPEPTQQSKVHHWDYVLQHLTAFIMFMLRKEIFMVNILQLFGEPEGHDFFAIYGRNLCNLKSIFYFQIKNSKNT